MLQLNHACVKKQSKMRLIRGRIRFRIRIRGSGKGKLKQAEIQRGESYFSKLEVIKA